MAPSGKPKRLPNFKLLHEREQARVERFKVRRRAAPLYVGLRRTSAQLLRTCPCAHVPLRPASPHCARGRGLATHSARLRPQDAHSRPLTRPQPFKLRTNNWAGEDGEEPAADGTQSQRVAVPPAGAFASLPPRPRALCPAHRLYRRGRCKPAAAARAGHHSSSGAGGIGGSSRGCAGAAHRGTRADAPHAAAVQAAERQPPPRGPGPHRPLTATLKRSRRRRARSTGSAVGH